MGVMAYLRRIKYSITVKRIRSLAKRNRLPEICKYRLADIELFRGGDKVFYCSLKNRIEEDVQARLKKKKSIKVAFVLYSASMWSCEMLYRFFEQDGRFDPYILLLHDSISKDEDSAVFRKSLLFFQEQNYKVRLVPLDTPLRECYAQMGRPDIAFYLTPYSLLLPVGTNLAYLPASVLTVYIPYSYMLSYAPHKSRSPGMALTWRHYAESEMYRRMLVELDDSLMRNTFFVGYPKMDAYLSQNGEDEREIWKIAPDADWHQVKKIIYAPHHSLPKSTICTQFFSTFDRNCQLFLDYARNHTSTTAWILKPHPLLRKTVVMNGVFPTEQAYDAYLDAWRQLPNARVVEESTYIDIFKTSDAMILDSVSFLAEYQFTGKPILFLKSGTQRFNSFGMELVDTLYQVPGEDDTGIQAFIDNVVIGGQDTMGEQRRGFFEKYMEYYHKNGDCSASEKIYQEICEAVSE